MVRWLSVLLVAGLLGVSGCGRAPQAPLKSEAVTPPNTHQKIFEVKGVVIAVKPKEKSIEIKHEEIPGYMPAMTMPFDVKNTKELAGLQPGDSVLFRMLVTDTEGWIDQIRKISSGGTNVAPPGPAIQLLHE